MRSPTKRITGAALIELRKEMIEKPDKSDELVDVLINEIRRITRDDKKARTWKRVDNLQSLVGQHSMKISYLKSQMTKMIKGYEKKIKKLEAELEGTPAP